MREIVRRNPGMPFMELSPARGPPLAVLNGYIYGELGTSHQSCAKIYRCV